MMTNSERNTRQIDIGGLKMGGGAPVVVQSMCATRTVDIDETVTQVHQLANADGRNRPDRVGQ
jgi:(E)-4-hydroxy-3-methylbut-2-enyl-diphosphate synthase